MKPLPELRSQHTTKLFVPRTPVDANNAHIHPSNNKDSDGDKYNCHAYLKEYQHNYHNVCLFYAGKHDVAIWYDCWPPKVPLTVMIQAGDVPRGDFNIAQDALLLNVTASATREIGV